ncbi:MAG: FAD-dependent oxidoreductase [Balneolaceae bacterium]|nr:FAD-dependent oxidoreductase [Balneolaceae bacterium]MBO6546627.1 FAD-dependent oxidoreductase [Balneolaceae bacterium]MBO6648985.1 FAD-dependent oxidoreductase [Balneolaceae bacterium]
MTINSNFDAIIVGSGMGGMSAAAMLAKDGYKVLILEAALHPGGCSSSYPRKGYIFESGATTLIGFDENQPLRKLEEETGIRIPRDELNPSMKVWFDGGAITRYKDRFEWIEEAVRVFGNRKGQKKFWNLAFNLSEIVWKVSLKNPTFPPLNTQDWFRLATSNSPKDVWVLKYAFKSVKEVAQKCGVDSEQFLRFLDEQLMITAQAKSKDTPFLFGAPGLTYTNYSNFYVPGGLIEMINTIKKYVEAKGGALQTKEAVTGIVQESGEFVIKTKKDRVYKAPIVISNIPIWNMPDITLGKIKSYFEKEAAGFDEAWGAITMGIATTDTYPDNLGIHHQIHLGGKKVPHTNSESIFVSMSKRGDSERAPEGERTLNVSCHSSPEVWFGMDDEYEASKKEVHQFILAQLKEKLPGFAKSEIKIADTATPLSWENWVYRKKGRVGGIPQSMARSLLNWSPNKTPFKGLYLVGDTTYPGQGIPGVTLSGINVYYRVLKNHKKPVSV